MSDQPEERPPFFLRAEAGAPDPIEIPWLVRLLGLAIWGRHLMTTPAVHRLRVSATVLVIVTTYEWIAWSVLFNVIVNGSPLALSLATPLAMAFGALFAAGVLVFEQGILTSDSSLRQRVAFVARLVLIGLSALATALPLELLVFNEEINSRLKEEGLRREALFQYDKLDDMQATSPEAVLARVESRAVVRQYEAAQERLLEDIALIAEQRDAAATDRTLAQRDLNTALQRQKIVGEQVAAARSRLENAKDAEEKKRAEAEVASAERELRRLSTRMDALRQVISGRTQQATDRSATVSEKQTQVQELEEKIRAARQAAEDEERRANQQVGAKRRAIRDWLEKIQQSEAGEQLRWEPGEGGGELRDFNPYRAGFVHRSLILEDLTTGRPPRWPEVSEKKRSGAAALIGLEGTEEALGEERRAEDAWHFTVMYWRTFVVALFLPLLSILTKMFLLGEELGAYYSTRAQAAERNLEALRLVSALRAARKASNEDDG
jgi:hypothetical protein